MHKRDSRDFFREYVLAFDYFIHSPMHVDLFLFILESAMSLRPNADGFNVKQFTHRDVHFIKPCD